MFKIAALILQDLQIWILKLERKKHDLQPKNLQA